MHNSPSAHQVRDDRAVELNFFLVMKVMNLRALSFSSSSSRSHSESKSLLPFVCALWGSNVCDLALIVSAHDFVFYTNRISKQIRTMSLSMHSSSLSPCGVDWDVFRMYLDGHTVAEMTQTLLSDLYCNQTRYGGGQRLSSAVGSAPDANVLQFPHSAEASPSRVSPSPSGHAQQHIDERDGPRQAVSGSASSMSSAPSTPREPRLPTSTASHRRVRIEQTHSHAPADVTAVQDIVEEQLHLYSYLESTFLASPYAFVSSSTAVLPLKDRLKMIDLYYDLDGGLAELWFGDRLSRIDVEDDDLVEVGLPGLSEVSVQRQWRNLKRVCKVITAGFRGRDGMYIPRDTPLVQAIQQTFVLPMSSSQMYATLVFGFEHRLDSPALEPLNVHELSSLSSAIGSCWCDVSQLFVSDAFCRHCWHLGKLLDDKRVVSELSTCMLGSDAPKLLRQIKETFDEVHKAIIPTGQQPPAVHTAQHPAGQCSTVGSPACRESHQGAVSFTSTLPSAQLAHDAPVAAAVYSSHHHSYSRRFVHEFHHVLKQMSKICIQFSSSEKLRDVLNRFYTKLYEPLLRAGKTDVSAALAASSAPSQAGAAGQSAWPSNSTFFARQDTTTSSSLGGVSPVIGGDASTAVTNTSTFLASTSRLSSSVVVNGSVFMSISAPSAVGADSGLLVMPDLARNMDSRRYCRELCTFLSALGKTFASLQCVGQQDHSEYDAAAVDFCAVLRLFTQLLLAHE